MSLPGWFWTGAPGSDPDAPQPGIFGASKPPSFTRRDFAQNSNKRYWLAHSAQKLEGFSHTWRELYSGIDG